MIANFQTNKALPLAVTRQLEDMLFGVPASTAVYLIGLAIVPVALWWRSHDLVLSAISAVSFAMNVSRVAFVYWFDRRAGASKDRKPAFYWTFVMWIGSLYSVTMAILACRAFALGEPLTIAITVIAVAGYITGVVIRASAVPRLAVPHILLVFVPLIIATAVVSDREYLSAGFLLIMFCIGCIQLSKTVYERMAAQLLAEYQLSLLARTDYLTGLPNRASFDALGTARFHDACARRSGFVLALIDLDGFKAVNDTHGHAAGDQLLQVVSNRMLSVLDGRHFAARLGGDEFAVIFDPDALLQDAQEISNAIVGDLKRPFELAGSLVEISGSVGLAAFETPADNLMSILARADQALYRAKHAGRNQSHALVASMVSPTIAPPDTRASFGVDRQAG